MLTVKRNDIVKQIVKNRSDLTRNEIEFIVDRYFHYACQAVIHGHELTTKRALKLKLNYTVVGAIPKDKRKKFRSSLRMYGYVLVPTCHDEDVKRNGYNYKPSDFLINAVTELADTDMIYTFMKQ
jgi:hypothetical protein